MDDLYTKYRHQKNGAIRRGIAFDMSFDEWKDIWDGKFHQRGRGSGQLGMLRTRDEGGYSVGNVRLGTPKENMQEMAVCKLSKTNQTFKSDLYRPSPPASTSWMDARNKVFEKYCEDDENIC